MSIEAASDEPRWEAYVESIAAFTRLIRFDPRGIGLSDPLGSVGATIEQYAGDTLAVMSAAGSDEAALLAAGHSGPAAVFLAATNPSAIRALVLINTYARILRTDDYSAGIPPVLYNRFMSALVEPVSPSAVPSETVDDLPLMAPSRMDDGAFRTWWRQAGHRGASPATARSIFTMAGASDVRDLLPQVQAPTMVIHAVGNNFVRADHGRYLASHLPKAKLVEIDSSDHLPWTDDTDTVGEIEEFLTGTRHAPTGIGAWPQSSSPTSFSPLKPCEASATRYGASAWIAMTSLRHDRSHALAVRS